MADKKGPVSLKIKRVGMKKVKKTIAKTKTQASHSKAGSAAAKPTGKDKMTTLCEFLKGPPSESNDGDDAGTSKPKKGGKAALKRPAAAKKIFKKPAGATADSDEDLESTVRDRNKFNHFQKYYDDLPAEVREVYEAASHGKQELLSA